MHGSRSKHITLAGAGVKTAILPPAADTGADSWCWRIGHSRLSEFILGGVTRAFEIHDGAGADVALIKFGRISDTNGHGEELP